MSKETIQLNVAEITLVFPNNTYVIMRGDEEVVTQLVKKLDGVEIEYTSTDMGSLMGSPHE